MGNHNYKRKKAKDLRKKDIVVDFDSCRVVSSIRHNHSRKEVTVCFECDPESDTYGYEEEVMVAL